MINPKICGKCEFSKIHKQKYDKFSKEKISDWSCDCYVNEKSPSYFLEIIDEPPKQCPFYLEHLLTMKLSKEDIEYIKNS